jgi:hypothetical protein
VAAKKTKKQPATKPRRKTMNDELELNLEKTRATGALKVLRVKGADLSAAQVEFNRLMKRLENERARYAKEESRLDRMMAEYVTVVMPLHEKLQRLNMEMVFESVEVIGIIKLSAKRLDLFSDLICGKASDLLRDPCGLAEEELEKLRGILREMLDRMGVPPHEDYSPDDEADEFDILRRVLEAEAAMNGVDLDLGGLDMRDDPDGFHKQLHERFARAMGSDKKRKPTKAQLEKEKKRQQIEEAKNRNFKTLFKQLAKLLHPDLETDHSIKKHKETWMKRLTSAYESGDLREMLQIEMEWLGGMTTELAGASDEKLIAYNMVLKEQINEVKLQTQRLLDNPKYFVLMRFVDDFFGELKNPAQVRHAYEDDLRRHDAMLQMLRARDGKTKKVVSQWADEHGRAMRDMDRFPF